MYYPVLDQRLPKELLAGVNARTFWGEKMLMAAVDLAAQAVIPPHSHVHEQCGVVLSGRLVFDIAGEVKELGPGDLYLIPGGVVHSVRVGSEPARVVDIFSPVRQEYQY